MSRTCRILFTVVVSLSCGAAAGAQQPPVPEQAVPAAQAPVIAQPTGEPQPFGANLFLGNFSKSRDDGLNPDYVIMPGDQVAVNTWGSVQITGVFPVDGQGNIFLPEIGPVALGGARNAELTGRVQERIGKVYRSNFGVYTNLLNASPVAVFVTGAVNRPGRYAGSSSDSALFFLDQAGGINPDTGSYRKIEVLRGDSSLALLDLYDFILRGKIATPQFKDGDVILVSKRGPVVELNGSVTAPALVEFKPGPLTGTGALDVVPGTPDSTEVTLKGTRGGRPYQETLSVSEFRGTDLEDGDVVTLRDDGRAPTLLVTIEGEFDGPSVFSVKRGSRLLDLLNYVPSDPALANTGAVHIRRASVAVAQKDAINDSLFRLERSAMLALSNTTGETEIRVKEAELVSAFVERARQIDPLGRVVTAQSGHQRNVLLEAGDVIVIPRATRVVRVGGEVMMSQAVIHRPNLTAEQYVEMAGGYSDRANDDEVIIIHADASVAIVDPDTIIMPGDEILVPPEIDVKELQNAMDVMQIIYQVAVASAVLMAI